MIGYGRLGKILAEQWCQKHHIVVSSPTQLDAQEKNGTITKKSNRLALDADILVLAVKPALIGPVLEEIIPILKQNTCIVSLAAGITLEQLTAKSPQYQFVRAMPNINAEVQSSATLLLKDPQLSPKKQELIEELFSSIGDIYWVENDELLDIGTILAGSGPAYVFYLMDAFQNAAQALGMDLELSQKLIVQTFLGSAKLAKQNQQPFTKLSENVISPKGTTAAALDILSKNQIDNSIHQALESAWQKILELRC